MTYNYIKYSVSIPIEKLLELEFEIGSYYTVQHKPISTRYNRIRWVSGKRTKTFIDMQVKDIEINDMFNFATIYFECK